MAVLCSGFQKNPMRFFYSPPGQPSPYLRLPSLSVSPDVLGRADSDVEAHDAEHGQGRDAKNCRVYGRRWWVLLCTYVASICLDEIFFCYFLGEGQDFLEEKTYQKHNIRIMVRLVLHMAWRILCSMALLQMKRS